MNVLRVLINNSDLPPVTKSILTKLVKCHVEGSDFDIDDRNLIPFNNSSIISTSNNSKNSEE